jgi:hypothetical protein
MNKPYKYIVLLNKSENIGDDIQSLAATRFIPGNNLSYLYRDDLSLNKVRFDSKVIMNAWWGTKPSNILKPNTKVDRLLTSVHLTKRWRQLYSKQKWLKDLKKYEPIGARDLETHQFLTKLGVSSFFSGCVTLTLLPNYKIKRNNRILAIDLSDRVNKYLKANYTNQVDFLSQTISPHLSGLDRMEYAKYLLYLFNSYSIVVTTRLHVSLPCLALQTPVLLVRDDLDKVSRFSGLYQLVNNSSEMDFLTGNIKLYSLKNSNKYIALRIDLEKKIEEFTGYNNKTTLIPDELNIHDTISLLTMNNDRYKALKKYVTSRINFSYFVSLTMRMLTKSN